MKNILISIIIILPLFKIHSQSYSLYESKIICDQINTNTINEGDRKIKFALNSMIKEGKLVNFYSNIKTTKDKTTLTYTVPAENDAAFKKIVEDWKKRASIANPELFKTFWKTCATQKDTLVNKTKLIFPFIKDSGAPVAVVADIDENPDPTLNYNMVFDFTAFPEKEGKKYKVDSSSINWGLSDIGRIYNLHVAAGIPRSNINFVVAIHAFAMSSFFNNAAYQTKFKIDNPNLSLLEELSNAGINFLVCGQSLTWMGYNKQMLDPKVKVALSAQTVLSSYQMKGYGKKIINND